MIWIALFVVILALAGWIGVCIGDNARDRDKTVADLVMAQKFLDDLERQTAEWRR